MHLNVQKFTSSELDKLSLVKDGDTGHFGKIYRLNWDECIKIYNDTIDDFLVFSLNEKTNVSLETATMPKRLAVVDKKVKGYIMDYVFGPRLLDCMDYDYSKFIKTYGAFVKKASEEISLEGYSIIDASVGNIMLDLFKKEFKLVDTDLWKREDSCEYEELLNRNFTELNLALFNRFLFLLGYDIAGLTPQDDFVDYYETLREDIEKRNNIKIKTLGDVRKRWTSLK